MENNQFDKMISEVLCELKTISKACTEISELLRILARGELETKLSALFSNQVEMSVYELSNGNRPSREISEIVGISFKTISNLWKKWASIGIVEPRGVQKPYRAKYSLAELALLEGRKLSINV